MPELLEGERTSVGQRAEKTVEASLKRPHITLLVFLLLILGGSVLFFTSCSSPTDPQERYDGEWLGTLETGNKIFFRIAYDQIQRVTIDDFEERVLFPLGNEIEDSRFKVHVSVRDIYLEGHFVSEDEAEGTLHAGGDVYSWSAIKVRTKNGRLLVEQSYFWEPNLLHLNGESRGRLVLEKVDLVKMVKHRYRLGFGLDGDHLVLYLGDLDRAAYLFYQTAFADSMQLRFDGIQMTLIDEPEYPFTTADLYEFWFE